MLNELSKEIHANGGGYLDPPRLKINPHPNRRNRATCPTCRRTLVNIYRKYDTHDWRCKKCWEESENAE